MGISVLIQGMTAAMTAGIGCGTCCSPSVSFFLSGYLMTHAGGMRQSVKAALSFYLGKMMAVVLACTSASLLGSRVIGESGMIAGIDIKKIVNGFMAAMAVWFLLQWFLKRRGEKNHDCSQCRQCGTAHGSVRWRKKWAIRAKDKKEKEKKMNLGALWGMGVGYGISPCAPLLMMVGYTATLPVGYAALVGAVFALASSLSPMLVMVLLSGALSGQIQKEIPEYIEWFRLGCYVLLLVFCVAAMI